MDKNLTNLLKWSIEHSAPSDKPHGSTLRDPNVPEPTESSPPVLGAAAAGPNSALNAEVLAAIMGGPSDADLMKAAMEVLHDPSTDLENKLIAFDNFEQLIESLDNANNLANLSLWTPLLQLLGHENDEIRLYAAWCVGTAVQNNIKSQERLLAMGGIPLLVERAIKDGEGEKVRRKAIYALSSAVRNYQPALDAALEELGKQGAGDHGKGDKIDATDMEVIDEIMGWLKGKVAAAFPKS
ncbi:nucleotide exchange factor Fes1-domain-containing protein [Podospora fimiseda]|uniref:Nucleotide exchange factor Fes1-domain-containing protein n=1 Tax=Podospora fimiseda TaxID=252190 RepID=A0AAN7H0B8_9PEZI|nr:nucleotide exchange factor Fes1-domain-containing protein [Podospora fimiseda]